MADRITIGPPASKLDWDNWGKPMTDAVNEHDELINTAWVTSLPTFSSSGGGAALGNGLRNGRYKSLGAIGLILYEFHFIFGSTSTFGSGFFRVSLPVNASVSSQGMSKGIAYFYDTGTLTRCGGLRFDGVTHIIADHPTLGVVTSTVPHTWANTDEFVGQIFYEPAV